MSFEDQHSTNEMEKRAQNSTGYFGSGQNHPFH